MNKIVALVLSLLFCVLSAFALADEYFIICHPESFVNVREAPKKRGDVIGRLELGDKVESDGKEKNGYLHLINLPLEMTDGWVSLGYVTGQMEIRTVTAEIESKGRVACRRYINGKRRKWLRDGDQVTVYGWSDDWAITSQGYIMTKYLEVQSEQVPQSEN